MKYVIILSLAAMGCTSNPKDKILIETQKKEIDSLKVELNNYKILHEIAKETIEKDTAYTN
jgi:hypothetical protein